MFTKHFFRIILLVSVFLFYGCGGSPDSAPPPTAIPDPTQLPTATPQPIPSPTATPASFSYLIKIRDDETGERVDMARVTIEVIQKAALDELVDSEGVAMIMIEESYVGKPAKMIVEAEGYETYTRFIDLTKIKLPDTVTLRKSPPKPETTGAEEPVPTEDTADDEVPAPAENITDDEVPASAEDAGGVALLNPASTQHVIADFDRCNGISNLNGEMGVAFDPPDDTPELLETYVQEPDRGCVAKLQYDVDDWGVFWINLNGFDASQFNVLAFEAKGEAGQSIPVEFKVELKRNDNQEMSVAYLSGPQSPDQWVEYSVRLDDLEQYFNNPPLSGYDNLSDLVFTFEAGRSGRTGVLYVDNIRFEQR